jgi:hypothetical protein
MRDTGRDTGRNENEIEKKGIALQLKKSYRCNKAKINLKPLRVYFFKPIKT